MSRRALTTPTAIVAILILQILPLMLFPPEAFAPTTQEWWLPMLLAVMVAVADVYLIARHTTASWPWSLMTFAQGFNIISRLMMVWSHAVQGTGQAAFVDWPYIILTALSIVLSTFTLWYSELPEVRMGLFANR